MKKSITLIFLFCCSFYFSYAQFKIDWQQSYGGSGGDEAYDILQVDGGYLVAGIVKKHDGQINCGDDADGWLFKMDSTAQIVWQRCYPHVTQLLQIIKAQNEPYYYLIGGGFFDPYPNCYRLWIGKIDSVGNELWGRSLGNNYRACPFIGYGEATPDGGIIATSSTQGSGGDISEWYGGWDTWVVKLDSLGNIEWEKSIGTSRDEFCADIIQTKDYGYLAGLYGEPNGVGNIDSITHGGSGPDAVLFKMDKYGNHQWHRCYGGSRYEAIFKILELEDGYILACSGSSDDGDMEGAGWHTGWHNGSIPIPTGDVWLVRIDVQGRILWQKCYGGTKTDYPKEIFQTSDGGFIVFADCQSVNGDAVGNPSTAGRRSIWIFKVDSNGNMLWQQCIGGPTKQYANSVIRHSDKRYTMAGCLQFSPSGDVDCSNYEVGHWHDFWVLGISDTTLSVPEYIPQGGNVKIYPNPAAGFVNIEISRSQVSSHTQLRLIDIQGKCLKNIAVGNNWHSILDISDIAAGLYIVEIHNGIWVERHKISVE